MILIRWSRRASRGVCWHRIGRPGLFRATGRRWIYSGRFLAEKGMPRQPAGIRREHVEAFLADLLERTNPCTGREMRPATAANRFRSLQAFQVAGG